ncbi:Ribonuclease H-like domain [Pseudocohnilembus persalinus]|uniref:Ribonuclease H-like domain n=1 Tax=Pseudocohnilembus persalinus TaxID=266149 RepID=A0A0V0QC45_PSEPJ|nr:Ribonuclease H-like domain [Pseudocohnilembus persalinus]|eukprot:KRW99797.1 Ribonuclease H-like domain [Pseudocohnilembus persalinus]
MSGIVSKQQLEFDLPFEIYNKKKQVAEQFSIIQIGISIFTQESDNEYKAYPFNFYVFPRKNDMYNPIISFQLGSIEFNTQYDMDYNRWIKKGISYFPKNMGKEKMQKFKELIVSGKNVESQLSLEQIWNKLDEDRKQITKQIIAEIDIWRYNDTEQIQDFKTNGIRIWYIRDYLIKYLNQNKKIDEEFVIVPSLNKNEYDIKIRKLKISEDLQKNPNKIKNILEDEKIKMVEQEFESYKQFLNVMEIIWERKLPIIGHNCLMDHLFTYRSFYDSLPSYKEWKDQLIKLYPEMYDTKQIMEKLKQKNFFYQKNQIVQNQENNMEIEENKEEITQHLNIGDTSLENVKKYINVNKHLFTQELKVTIPEGFTDYTKGDSENYHEAGFDSYLTGLVFLNLQKNFKETVEAEKNIFNIRNKLYFIKFGADDLKKDNSLVYVVKENSPSNLQKQQQNNYQMIDNKRQEEIKSKFQTQLLENKVQFYFQINGYGFIILPEKYLNQDEEIQQEFIRKIVGLKACKFQVSTFPEYFLKIQALDDQENKKKKQ